MAVEPVSFQVRKARKPASFIHAEELLEELQASWVITVDGIEYGNSTVQCPIGGDYTKITSLLQQFLMLVSLDPPAFHSWVKAQRNILNDS